MKKHELMTDMTFGQLYDALDNGEDIYVDGEKAINVIHRLGRLAGIGMTLEEMKSIKVYGKVTRLIDDSLENQPV